MTRDTEEQHRMPSGEAADRAAQEFARFEAPQEPTNAGRFAQGDGRGAVRLIRRGERHGVDGGGAVDLVSGNGAEA